jgi:hypothetical protein
MKKVFFILIFLFIALAVRLYPTVTSGMPFSTDAWPLIRNTELLMQNTPIALNSPIFDGYDIYWPTSQIFGVIFSQVTSLPPLTALGVGVPFVAALAIPLFYVLVKRLTGNNLVSLMATAVLAVAFPYALFMSGVTKETFASPIFISLILVFLLRHDWKTTVVFSILSVALVLSHHLTSLLAVSIVACLTVASYISRKTKGENVNSTQTNLFLLAILSAITAGYFVFYALPAFPFAINFSDLLSVGAYIALLVSAVVYFVLTLKKPSRIVMVFSQILAFAVVALVVSALLLTNILPGAPTIPLSDVLYAFPFFIMIPMVTIALHDVHQKKQSVVFPLFWLVSILAFAAYALFSSPLGAVRFTYRSLDFMLLPLTILVALGAYKLYDTPKRVNTRRLTKAVVALILLSLMGISVYSVYATVSLQEPYLGYFWRYQPSEYAASGWLAANANNQTVAADIKVFYLLHGYFGEDIDVVDGLRYLEGNGSAPELLYIYNQMYKNGYVLYEGSPVPLPSNWTDQLANYNCVYANSEVTIYAKR